MRTSLASVLAAVGLVAVAAPARAANLVPNPGPTPAVPVALQSFAVE
jgi:hypothetical protein